MEREREGTKESASDEKEEIFVKVGRRTIRLAWSKVSWIEVVEGRSLRVHTATGEHYLTHRTLKSLGVAAVKHGLARISKSIMVSVSQIKGLRRGSDGYIVYLGCGAGAAELSVSRRKTPEIKRLLRARGVPETR